MLDPVTLIIIPIIIMVLGLIIEYWVIQPLRKSQEDSHNLETFSQEVVSETEQNRIARLFYASANYSTSQLSSKFIEGIGYTFIVVPVFVASILATLLAIPLFMGLYMSEKLGGCRFKPTCKEYLVQSIEIQGPIKGLWLGIIRTIRCNPFVHGGYDPVSLKGAFSNRKSRKFDKSNFKVNLKTFLVIIIIIICVLCIEFRLLVFH